MGTGLRHGLLKWWPITTSGSPSRLTSAMHTPAGVSSPVGHFQRKTARVPGASRNFPLPSLRNRRLLPSPLVRKRSGQPSLLTSATATPSPDSPAGKPTSPATFSKRKPPLLRHRAGPVLTAP